MDDDTKAMLCLGFVIALFWCGYYGYHRSDNDEFRRFRTEHSCKAVATMPGEIVRGGFTSDKTGWLCDDGITHWHANED